MTGKDTYAYTNKQQRHEHAPQLPRRLRQLHNERLGAHAHALARNVITFCVVHADAHRPRAADCSPGCAPSYLLPSSAPSPLFPAVRNPQTGRAALPPMAPSCTLNTHSLFVVASIAANRGCLGRYDGRTPPTRLTERRPGFAAAGVTPLLLPLDTPSTQQRRRVCRRRRCCWPLLRAPALYFFLYSSSLFFFALTMSG